MADEQTTEELTRAIQALQQAMAQNKTVDPKEIDRLDKALKNAARGSKAQTDAQKIQTEAIDKGSKGATRFAGALGGTVRNLGNFASSTIAAAASVQEQQESFSSLNGSIDLTAGVLKTAGKAVGGVTDSLGEALKGIPVLGGVIGGLVSAAGKAAAALAEAAAEVGAQIAKQAMAQLDSAGGAFRQIQQAGALGAGGMSQLADQAIGAGLSFKDFADVTKNATQGLAFGFATATDGADRFANISKDMTPFRRELEALGVGAKQQNEMTANYLKLQARTARIENMSNQELAQGSANYIKELNTLSRLTGQTVSETEKELAGQLRNARFNGAIQDINARLGVKAGKDAQQAAVLVGQQNETIGKGLQDIIAGNALTDEAQGFILATGERGARAVAALQEGQISGAEAYREIQLAQKERVEAMGGPAALAKIVGAGTAFDNVASGMLNANAQVIPTTEQIRKMGVMTEKSLTPQDENTKGLVDGYTAMREYATEVNRITKEALPAMGTAATTVAQTMTKAMREINKMIEMGAEAYVKDSMLGTTNTDEMVEKQDESNTKYMTTMEKASTSLAKGIEFMAGLFSTDLENKMQAVRVQQQTAGGMAEKRFGKKDLVEGYKLEKKALGGPVQAGGAYIVGEQGPEMLVSGMDGNIIPNNALAAMASSMGTVGPLDGMAGPANALAGTGTNFNAVVADLQSTLSGSATSGSEAGAGSAMSQASNTLAEAQLNRLDTIASTMARSVSVQTEILNAAHR